MRCAPLFLLLLSAAASAAACADATDDNASPDEQGTEQDLTLLTLKCRSGSTTFDIEPGLGGAALEGKLSVSSSQNTMFACRSPASDAGASHLVVSCNERPQTVHPGQWNVDVRKTGQTYKATLKKGSDAGADVTMTCTAPSRPDAGEGGTADAGEGGPPLLTWAEVKPILDSKCNGCHHGGFGTLEGVKTYRQSMIEALSNGVMPRFQPTWKDTADGKKVLDFLRHSPELQ